MRGVTDGVTDRREIGTRIASHRIAHGDGDDDGTDRNDEAVLREKRRKTSLDYHATTRIFLEFQ